MRAGRDRLSYVRAGRDRQSSNLAEAQCHHLSPMKSIAGMILMASACLVGGHGEFPKDDPSSTDDSALAFTWEIRLFALVMTLISSLATGIGGLIVALGGTHNKRQTSYLLNFSFGVMIYISFADILADTTHKLGWIQANLAFFGGMVAFLALRMLVPEADIVALAVPADGVPGETAEQAGKQRSLIVSGILTTIGISLHNIPEGIAVYMTCLKGVRTGLPLAVAMSLHNIPEGIAVAVPIYVAYKSKWLAVKWSLCAGLFELVGAFIVAVFFVDVLTPHIMDTAISCVAGVMVVLCFTELLPELTNNVDPQKAVLVNITGMFCMFGSKVLCEMALESSTGLQFDKEL